MDKTRKQEFRYFIVSNDRTNIFDFTKGFFELDHFDIERIDKYAEIFNIKSDKDGRSRARVLWYELQNSNKKYNL